jgi:hypothetical protein
LPLAKGPYQFPIVLYGHALRYLEDVADHPYDQDFTTVGTILSQLASYGCVCVAPDLSWSDESGSWQQEAPVFIAVYHYLAATLNQHLFNNQLRLTSVVLIGHSHRAGSVVNAGRVLPQFQGPTPLAYGLIAPEFGGDTGNDITNLLVLGGSLDNMQSAEPGVAFTMSANPKTWVQIPGANHFGYTDLVSPDNVANCGCSTGSNLNDNNGTILRAAQQQVAGAYLAAMVRYYALGDGSTRDYLSGDRQVEGLSVTGLQLQEAGLVPQTPTSSRPTVSTHP